MTAQGNALGIGASNKPKALKGQHNCLFFQRYDGLTGLMMCWSFPLPRALPWAFILKPFGLNNVIHCYKIWKIYSSLGRETT
jgi:hypothetical protein